MKKVLFVGVTNYNFHKDPPLHLKRKFLGLGRGVKPFVLAKGAPFHKELWGTEFFLLPPILFWPLGLWSALYLSWSKRIDIIIAESPLTGGIFGTAIKKVLKKELIVEIHGDWVEGPFLSKKRIFKPLQKRIVPILAKISFKNADKIRGVADHLVKRAEKVAPQKKYFIFPTFTDLSLFLEEKEIAYEQFILSVGQLEKVKGIDILIEAFSKIEKEFPYFKLIIIGEGAEKKNLEEKINTLGLEDKITLKGKLSLSETKDIMKKCYCLVLASRSEGLPRVLMEAMALNKAVVASRVGGIPSLIKDGKNGFLFEADKGIELATKLTLLLKNQSLAKKMGRMGKGIVENRFSNEKYIENYISMINM